VPVAQVSGEHWHARVDIDPLPVPSQHCPYGKRVSLMPNSALPS